MPTPDTSGVPPFADFEMLKGKINEIVQKYNNLLVNLDSLNVVSITANSTTITSNLDGGAYIRLDGNGIVVNDGTGNTFQVDTNGHVTMTGAKIQSKNGTYPYVEMDPDGNLFGAYASPTQSLVVGAYGGSNAPYLEFDDGSDSVTTDLSFGSFNTASSVPMEVSSTNEIYLSAGTDLILYPGSSGYVKVYSWGRFYSDLEQQPMDQALASKATAGASTGSAGSHNHGISPGRYIRTYDSAGNDLGLQLWVAASDHVHAQR